MALSLPTLLCNHYHHPSPGLFHHPQMKLFINLVFLPDYSLSPWDHHPTFYLYVTDSPRDLEDSDSTCSSVDWFSSCSICCCCLFAKSRLTLYDLIVYSPPGSSCLWNSPDKNTGVGCHSLLQGIFPDPGIELRSPALQADSIPPESPGKPSSTQCPQNSPML